MFTPFLMNPSIFSFFFWFQALPNTIRGQNRNVATITKPKEINHVRKATGKLCEDGQTGTDRWTDGWMDGQRDGRMDRQRDSKRTMTYISITAKRN